MTEDRQKNQSLINNLIRILQKNNLGRKGIKKRIGALKKSPYGKNWQRIDEQWYSKIYSHRPELHNDFIRYLKNRTDIKTVLEIGCGTGTYPIKFKNLFSNMKYVGVDIGAPAIEYCKRNSEFEFICGDFIKMEFDDKYDLVFSHAVIDHVYDIDRFLSKIVSVCKKYAYISAYRGYFPNLEQHEMVWDNEKGCYYNNISLKQVEKIFLQNALNRDEFTIREQKDGIQLGKPYSIGLNGMELVIEIQRQV